MITKTGNYVSILFALLSTWVIFGAIPYFRLNGLYPQVDTQIIFLHSLAGIMSFFIAIMLILKKYNLNKIIHPLILLPFSFAFLGLISSLLGKNFNFSLFGSPQIGQGVFWYFDLAIMSFIFSQIIYEKKVKILIFLNLFIVTTIVTLFTFYPSWKNIPISFYYFTDYLCFYGVLCFILFTFINKNKYFIFLAYLLLGLYFSYLDNRAAVLFWLTTALVASTYFILNLISKYYKIHRFKDFIFSNFMFVFIIILISFLTLFSSLYFWASEFNLPLNIKDTILDAPVVRGKIIENSLLALDNFKSLILGVGWGAVPDLLLKNMSSWQYDELRLGYNLHFHTHNDFIEHFVSLGLIGGVLFLIYVYFIFREAEKYSFLSKLGWLLFFKINCFWFLWTGTLTIFAVVVSCFIFYDSKKSKMKIHILLNNIKSYYFASFTFVLISIFLFYGTYLSISSIKVNSKMKYAKIAEYIKSDKDQSNKCLSFYNDNDRGGFLLDRFLSQYSSYIFATDITKLDNMAFNVLYELQCKANLIIDSNKYSLALLSTAMQVDTNFYYKFGTSDEGKVYLEKNYVNWLNKAIIMAQQMPDRGDLILPFLSFAINNNKNEDALKVCSMPVKGIEAFCYLITANNLLMSPNINQNIINNSIELINKAVDKGLFNEMIPGYWLIKKDKSKGIFYNFWGIRGIPLSADILFLISEKEKARLEEVIKR